MIMKPNEIKLARVLGGGLILTIGAAITTVLTLDWASMGETPKGLAVGVGVYAICTLAIWAAYDKLIRQWND